MLQWRKLSKKERKLGYRLKLKRGSIIADLIALSIVPLVIFGIIVIILGTITCTNALKKEVKNGLGSLAYSLSKTYSLAYDGDYTVENGVLKKGDQILTGHSAIIDDIKKHSNIDATIFYSNIRMLTTIKNTDGCQAIGTLASSEVKEKVLCQGKDYFSDNVLVNGTPYFGYYIPLKNSDTTIVGMAFVGKPRKIVLHSLHITVLQIIIIGFVMLILTASFCLIYAKRMEHILKETMNFLGKIAKGNLRESMDSRILQRNDEIAEIGKFAVLLQKSISELIGTDPLTGLYNRRSCNVSMENLIQHCKKTKDTFSLAMGDIDNFKKINDCYGHQFGDIVLKKLAKLFIDHMEDKGFIFRWGGEEFLFVYENTDIETAYQHLENLLEQIISLNIYCNNSFVPVTMTFGLVQYNNSLNMEDLIKAADDKLYWGKTHNKNQVVK